MRKFLLFLIAVVIVNAAGYAQPQAYNATVEYQKAQPAAAAIELPYVQDVVEDAIKDYMVKKGSKSTSLKGFTVYRGCKLNDGDTAINDLHFKVQRKPRDKSFTIIYLLVAKPGQDPATGIDSSQIENAKSFLNNLVPVIEEQNLNVQIKTQEEVVKKAQKKLNGLMDDQGDYEKKIRKLQADIEQNKKDQMKQAQDMQANIYKDEDAMKKTKKKMNKLLDDQSDMEKKLRKTQTQLDDNKKDQEKQQQEVEKQQQALTALQSKKKN